MNRKLLNGLLVLAVAAGGVGTFTSCKDENIENEVLVGQLSLQAQLDALRGLSDTQFQANLEKWLSDHHFETEYPTFGFNSYEDATQAIQDMYAAFTQVKSGSLDFLSPEAKSAIVGALYDLMFEEKIKGSDWYNNIFDAMETLKYLTQASNKVSSVDINQTINPVFGSINLPIGLKTSVLAAYLYKGDASAEYMFPTQVRDVEGGVSHLALDFDQYPEYVNALSVIQKLAANEAVQLTNGSYTMPSGFGNMGATYVNINPSSVNFDGSKNVQLVNSKDEVVLDAANGGLVVENNEDVLSWGYSRGDNTGVYKVNANVEGEFAGVTVDFDHAKDYLSNVKEAIKDKTISNIAYLGEMVYMKINNLLPAYALKVWWEEPVFDPNTGVVMKDENGEVVTTVNSVRSSYDLAAAVIHPLSYGTSLSEAFNSTGISSKRMPMFSPLRDILAKLQNKLTIDFKEIQPIEDVELDLYLTVEDGKVWAYDDNGEKVASFDYDSYGIVIPQDALNSLLDAILSGVNYELSDDINTKIVAKINDAIAQINEQLGQYNAKVEDFVTMVENNRFYDYATKLVDIYNKVAEKVNNVIENPNHYLQVAMIYSDGNGHYHHLSTDPKDPVTAAPANGGNAIELLATSYTGDVVVPSYMKYVAVTAVNGKPASVADNSQAGEMFNKVLPGQVNRVPMKVSGFKSGDVLTVTYLSVDYHGVCSMQNYYVKVK